jgi:SAM-dependent methyltransferase
VTHYDDNYFKWQIKIGEFGGSAELFKFKDFIKISDNVLDFGCGGGFLLSNITAKNKIGIEPNEIARNYAIKNGLVVVKSTCGIENEWADVIISNHALEHTENPLYELRSLYNKLKKGGVIVFVVPQEFKTKFRLNDINKHLYTWCPLCAGNLFNAAGFDVKIVKTIRYKWPPHYSMIRKYFGARFFNFISKVYCILSRSGYQVRIIAYK